MLLFTFSQYHHEPLLLEGLNSAFHLLNDFPTQYTSGATMYPTKTNIKIQARTSLNNNNKQNKILNNNNKTLWKPPGQDYTLELWALPGRMKSGSLISLFILKLKTPLLYLFQIKIQIIETHKRKELLNAALLEPYMSEILNLGKRSSL